MITEIKSEDSKVGEEVDGRSTLIKGLLVVTGV